MGLLGGFKQHDSPENDEHVQEAAHFAVGQISPGLKLEKVLSAHKQVVAGTNFKLVLQTSSGNFEATVFKGLGGEAEMKLVDYKRAEGGADEAGGKLGGTKEVSTDDKDVKAAAQEVVKQLSAQSNSLEKMELAEVLSAHSKVHGGGTVYDLKLRLSQGSLPDTTVQAEVTRTLKDTYEVGTINKLP
eukprot:CAMPEP_0206149344 /NCGR_PEP_ID=MMETSP1473-20131121/37730_1 /ASSEMBLY_ACC=CAM_ASM_001109 /TAXON_ID=1461547 /ORGANISM="Stichococcus sp, Strain RCC1054" /LENGTH=186 /DNA_ID=CAMNT_0053546801 /DNA_START=573 /DNA_END=1133 /DNA_ORIENTATION=-